MKVVIYCILDEKEIPIYVGKTKNSLIQRKNQHQIRLNKTLSICELDVVDENEWKFWECYWIEQFRQWNFNLLNQNKGGGGVEFHTLETKNKMNSTPHPGTSEKLKGRKRPDVSIKRTGVKLSKETCNKISLNKIGHICYSDPDRTNKIVKSNKENYQIGSERNKRISEKLKGRDTYWVTKARSKPVMQFTKQGEFIKEWDNAVQIAIFLNKCSTSSISECCNNKRKTSYGYIWRFK